MCGIAGIVRFDRPASASREPLAAMRARLRHRGPDGEGELFTSAAALAHTRLAMVDPANGAQPFVSADGRYALVYNGELYNHHELRAALPGPWRTRTDTETLLAAWQQWGEDCLPRLDGMYAFFVWDEQRQHGVAVRDRLGVKPLAYRSDLNAGPDAGPGFAFASEAQALLPLHASPPRAELDAVVEYLVAPAFSGVSRSPFADIEYLPPGHILRVARAGISLHRYWRWQACPDVTDAASEIAAADVRDALADGVRGALRADVPIGLFSSGGLDSTAVAALARRHQQHLPAFTIRFADQERWDASHSVIVVSDDTPHAAAAAAALDLDAREVFSPREHVLRELEAVARVDDALPAWEQEISQRVLARAAAAEVKGILVGDAADETHYGYHFLLDERATASPRAIFERLGSVPVAADIDPAPAVRLDAEYRALAADAGWSFDDRRARVLATTQIVVERWLPRLLHNGDIHCMAFGLEPRVPFAARALLDLAARVEPAVALRGGVEKWLLRDSLRGIIPEDIRTRRKSALPKDQAVGALYRDEARRLLRAPHPLVARVVDLPALQPLLRADGGPLSEVARAILFRVIALHHWAVCHEVAAP